ncbi:MAG: UDP-glucose/GDP-mannose dehydrogenase family protein [Actinomycetota bacterium]|nr:UDP-glucose/GDP-mannose dehydrogenase family protein [Actinomycetota bacterium]MDA3026458.1 UDP-glucose/GDP-mannose dehydrogenase family protein [Actinomycetota bacterium]
MAKIAIIGTGYVGLASAVGFAHLGHDVVGIDIDKEKITKLSRGKSPIYEKDMEVFLKKSLKKKKIQFSTDYSKVGSSKFVFLCLPTPQLEDGAADISFILESSKMLSRHLKQSSTIVIKSTVPVNTWKLVKEKIDRDDVAIVSNPEFLREGTALQDFFKPDRIVVGSTDEVKAKEVSSLYKAKKAKIVFTDNTSAEIIKYASNSFLAIKLSFVNEIAAYAESTDANALEVLNAMGLDKRIGKDFLKPGPGWGGMCFPKDVSALKESAREKNVPIPLLDAALESNLKTHARIVEKCKKALGGSLKDKKISVWGLSFKANTDDIRFSPAISVIERLILEGAQISSFDPIVKSVENLSMKVSADIEQNVTGADAIVLLTEWQEFKEIDPKEISDLVTQKIIIDSRNLLNKNKWEKAGFTFIGNGYN